ncbi:uncharacterized protein E0L32_008944 [Thyridium curvatum]|uniref:M6 metalloprotease n=1 Tax=Thyridium curvatum TaxID=1093900 RepID=A0A507AK65_9PEZI|nr:uncharacterized protein E0L32_008944 [Thyridium curvatum]TPX09922.1 hypothetical protein E0L32_008944 [Thyridium curvatum]
MLSLPALRLALAAFIQPVLSASIPETQHTALSTRDVSACRLQAPAGVYLSLGFDYAGPCAPSTGTLRAFMFFVDFPDHPAPSTEDPQALYDEYFSAAPGWYAQASYGRLALNVTLEGDGSSSAPRFVRMGARADSYGWQRGLTYEAHQTYVLDALDAYTAATGRAAPTGYDVLYVVPTTRAAPISFSPTFMGEVRQRGSPSSAPPVAGKAVTIGMDAYATWKSKVINHETGHTMCLPDLYPEGRDVGLYVGGWDMMGYILGPSPDYFAWSQWRLGWISDAQVECVSGPGSSAHTLSALELDDGTRGGTKAVVVRHNGTDVLVAEARTRAGVDSASCATGVLLYTVSVATATGNGPVRVLDTKPNSGGCGGHEKNDAPLSTVGTSFTVPGWNVKVTLTGQCGSQYTIRVDVS